MPGRLAQPPGWGGRQPGVFPSRKKSGWDRIAVIHAANNSIQNDRNHLPAPRVESGGGCAAAFAVVGRSWSHDGAGPGNGAIIEVRWTGKDATPSRGRGRPAAGTGR